MDQNSIVLFLVIGGGIVLMWVNMVLKGRSKKVLEGVLAEGAMIIDVRSAAECKSGMYPGARNIPVDKLPSQAAKLGSFEKPVVVYCASGARAGQAVGILKSAGYTKVFNGGGIGDMPKS